jgi:MerR family copper efflux transcriptional regulator
VRYTISEVARGFDTAVSALRYYDELGLLPSAGRRGTVRAYGREQLRRLALIQLLHRDGLMSLADTAAVLAEPRTDDPAGSREILGESVRTMQRRIERLREAQQVLEHLLSCPRADPVRDCPVLRAQLEETVDNALGTGP